MKVKSEWRMFARKIANAEKVAQEKNQQVQQMNAQIEKSKEDAGKKVEKNRQLLAEYHSYVAQNTPPATGGCLPRTADHIMTTTKETKNSELSPSQKRRPGGLALPTPAKSKQPSEQKMQHGHFQRFIPTTTMLPFQSMSIRFA